MIYRGKLRWDIKRKPTKTEKANKPKSTQELPRRLLRLINKVEKRFGSKVWVHGSWARGVQTKESDLDLFVLSEKGHKYVNEIGKEIDPILDIKAIKKGQEHRLDKDVVLLHERRNKKRK